MKRILYLSMAMIAVTVLIAGCSKRDYYKNTDQERATVLDYRNGTPYSIIQYSYDGTYAIIESIDASTSLWPEKGDILDGTFYVGQTRRVYNVTASFYCNINVVENVPTLQEAYDALDYYASRYAISGKVNPLSLESQGARRGGVVK